MSVISCKKKKKRIKQRFSQFQAFFFFSWLQLLEQISPSPPDSVNAVQVVTTPDCVPHHAEISFAFYLSLYALTYFRGVPLSSSKWMTVCVTGPFQSSAVLPDLWELSSLPFLVYLILAHRVPSSTVANLLLGFPRIKHNLLILKVRASLKQKI